MDGEDPRASGEDDGGGPKAVEASRTDHDEGSPQGGEPPASDAEPVTRRFTLELGGELILLAMAGGLFLMFIYESITEEWSRGAALMPWIVAGIGLPLVAFRLLLILRPSNRVVAKKQIMDTGFRPSDDPDDTPQDAVKRFVRICLFVVVLYTSIWLLGFHVAMPLIIAGYMRIYGKASYLACTIVAIFFIAVIVGVYDMMLNTFWPEPVINLPFLPPN